MNTNEDVIIPQDQPWRQEVVSRVQQHRAKRRRRLDPGATLPLDFSDSETSPLKTERESTFALAAPAPVKPEMPKIIEFRRPPFIQPVFVPQNGLKETDEFELAEPVFETPRILEAPPLEQMDLLPAFADIQLESVEHATGERVELPPQ